MLLVITRESDPVFNFPRQLCRPKQCQRTASGSATSETRGSLLNQVSLLFSTATWSFPLIFYESITQVQWGKKGLRRKCGLHSFVILWAWISFMEQLSSQPRKQVCSGLLTIPTAAVHVSSVTAARWKSKWIALQMRHFSALTFQMWQCCLFFVFWFFFFSQQHLEMLEGSGVRKLLRGQFQKFKNKRREKSA